MELRNLYSNHSLQCRKLVSAGSYLTTLREETQVMCTHAESLTGRVDRVLSNTVQTILDGDNFLSAFGHAFGNPSLNIIERDRVERSAHTRSSTIHDNNYMNVHAIDSNVQLPAHPDAPPLVEDDERLGHPAPSPEGVPPRTQRMTTDPPL